MITTSITRRDNGLLGKIKAVASKCTAKVEIGYFSQIHHSANGKRAITTQTLAGFHVNGTSRMPKRDFINPPLKVNRCKYIKMTGKGITSAIRGRITTNQIWHLVGKEVVKDIQYYIAEGKFTPIAESTAKRKGTRVPLMETLQLHDQITYKVK